MTKTEGFFTAATFDFLRQLTAHNQKAWFDANRTKYEQHVKAPALAFIAAAGPRLSKISQDIVADPRPVGGSLMRVYRDIRFSKDRTPYKTNIGISFGHRRGREQAAPGYYLHLGTDREWGNFGGGPRTPEGVTRGKVVPQPPFREPCRYSRAGAISSRAGGLWTTTGCAGKGERRATPRLRAAPQVL